MTAVRRARPGDASEVSAVVLAAFGPHEGPTIVSVMAELDGAGLVETVLVAELESRVVGVVMLSRGWVDARPRLVDVLVLSPLPSRPASRAGGLATGVGGRTREAVSPDPAAACQVRLLPGHEEWMTGPLVYPDTWWRHDAVGLRDPLLADVEARLAPGPASGNL